MEWATTFAFLHVSIANRSDRVDTGGFSSVIAGVGVRRAHLGTGADQRPHGRISTNRKAGSERQTLAVKAVASPWLFELPFLLSPSPKGRISAVAAAGMMYPHAARRVDASVR